MKGRYGRTLKWPIISWVVVDLLLLVLSFIDSSLAEMMTPAVLAPLTLAFGVWVGYKMIGFGGNYGDAIVSGIIVGAVCGILTVVGFGGILGLGMAAIVPLGMLTGGFNVAGAAIGSGFALTK